MLLDLLEDLAGQDDHRCRPVSHLGVLRSGNVDEDAGGGVDDVEELCSVRMNVLQGGLHSAVRTFMTVAPSFVMVCRPFSSTIKRSPP